MSIINLSILNKINQGFHKDINAKQYPVPR